MNTELSEEMALIWKSKSAYTKIRSLKKLLDYMVNIKQENIDREIKQNMDRLISWVEENFSDKLELVAEIKSSEKEFTPQQFRERMVRILRKVI